MKPRLRSSVLLLVTLGIGMLLGALIQSNLRDKRIRHFHFMRNEANFIEGIETAIGPLETEQAAAVRAVLEATAPRVMSNIQESREAVRGELDKMKAQLAQLLNEEQNEYLAERLRSPRERREKREKENGGED